MQRGEGRAAERSQGREVGREPWRHELEQLLRLGDVLQPMPAERPEGPARNGPVPDDVARRLRDEDLPAVARRADAGGDVDVEADVALVAELGLAGVDADAHAHDAVRGPRLALDRALEPDRGRDRVAGAGEGEKGAVPAQSTSCPW